MGFPTIATQLWSFIAMGCSISEKGGITIHMLLLRQNNFSIITQAFMRQAQEDTSSNTLLLGLDSRISHFSGGTKNRAKA